MNTSSEEALPASAREQEDGGGLCSHPDCMAEAETRCGACHLHFCLAHIDEHMHRDHGLPDC